MSIEDTLYPDGQAPQDLAAAKATEEQAYAALAAAYRNLFKAEATVDEARLVLEDLATYSSFYMVAGPGTRSEDRHFTDGMRAVYGRVHNFLRMSADELHRLEERARASVLGLDG